jgi:hypothetical protein
MDGSVGNAVVIDAGSPVENVKVVDPIESWAWQTVGVAAATILIAAVHWANDGLWFQGDAPRHAANGFFFWDLLTSLPTNPLAFALSYYARYPVITPGAYPPLFYVVEGLAFWLVAPSPYVAKVLILACAALTGFYTMLWARRWIAPAAGWAGPCVIMLRGFVVYSNAVLLNVPSTALMLAALYHFHAWLDTARPRDRALFVWLTAGAILTYYPGGLVLPIAVAWTLCFGGRASARFLWVVGALLVFIVLVTAIVFPSHLARQAPSLTRLLSPINWTFYTHGLITLFGSAWCVLAICGLAGLATDARRKESALLALALLSAVVGLALLPARDERYALLLGPLVVLMAFVAIATAADAAGRWRTALTTGALAAVLTLAGWSAVSKSVPVASGFDEVARYLSTQGVGDAVLYSGVYDGVFGFYVRALDPRFERRLVLSNKLLYRYEQRLDFIWVETPYVASASDVVSLIQSQCGCRWVAVEVGQESTLAASDRHLRRALEGPEFERVRSFPVRAGRITRVDLYRFTQPLAPERPIDLTFPSFSARVFRAIEPIARR